jgi:hypothetical protein
MTPVIDLSSSSDEEDLITATSCDFVFAQRLFGELNRAVLGSPDDGKIIVLNDFDEEQVCEEKTTSIEDVTASTVVNPTSTASANDAPVGPRTIIVMIRAPIRRLVATMILEMMPASLRLPRQEGAETGVLQGELQWFCIAVSPSLCAVKLG